MKLHKWDRSRLVYLYEHNKFTVSEVARFIDKTITNAQREAAKEMIRLYGQPVCQHLHHDKIDQHAHDEPCPVVSKIRTAYQAELDQDKK